MWIMVVLLAASSAAQELGTAEVSYLAPQINAFTRRSLLAAAPSVQKTLALSDRQKAEIELLRRKVVDELRRSPSFQGKAAFVNGTFHLTFDENDAALAEILDPKQLQTMGQIQLQALRAHACFRLESVARHIGVTDEQKREFDGALASAAREFAATMKQPALPGKGSAEQLRKLAEIQKQRHVDPLQHLTEAQRKLWKETLGPSHKMGSIAEELRELWAPRRREPSPVQSSLGDDWRPFSFLFVNEFLSEIDVTPRQRDALVEIVKLQRKECAALAEKLRVGGAVELRTYEDERDRTRNERATKLRGAIEKILTRKQAERLEEAWYQMRGYNEVFSGGTDAFKKLGITKEQSNEMHEFSRANRGDTAAILAKMPLIMTKEQRALYERMKGEPFSKKMIVDLKVSRNQALCDEFGIPKTGIGAEP